jgi:hypothetical protein
MRTRELFALATNATKLSDVELNLYSRRERRIR